MKTEIVLLMKERIARLLSVQVGDVAPLTKAIVKYLAVILDTRLTFWGKYKEGRTRWLS